jgi:photosystem II stability/assembly factor-like uncharacterized protein
MRYLFAMIILCCAGVAKAQTYVWKPLPLPAASDRYNDVWFATPEIGWAIIPGDFMDSGFVYKTIDGGMHWTKADVDPTLHYRSICFIDTLVGFVGRLSGLDRSPLIATFDGGDTWDTVTFDGPTPVGICGMMRVDDSTVVGSGQVYGPAHFIKTTDRGKTWKSYALPASAKTWGIDCYFTSRDSGIVVGGNYPEDERSHAIIYRTTDGGEHWTTAYFDSSPGEWCWKITFPSRLVGYISIEDYEGASNYLKTTDGGETWQRMTIRPNHFAYQGVGFIDELHGWMGGRANVCHYTTNGGESWAVDDELAYVNRFRFFGDSVGYAAGKYIYKLSKTSSVKQTASSQTSMRYDPASSTIIVSTPSTARTFGIIDILGREVMSSALDQERSTIDVSGLSTGIYIVRSDLGESLKFSR